MPRFDVTFRSDLEVIGYDPEYADMDCPRGERIAEVWYALAGDRQGNRWRWGWFSSREEAEAAFEHDAPPVSLWHATYPEYGSRAYQRYGEADLIEAEKELDEASLYGDTRFLRMRW